MSGLDWEQRAQQFPEPDCDGRVVVDALVDGDDDAFVSALRVADRGEMIEALLECTRRVGGSL